MSRSLDFQISFLFRLINDKLHVHARDLYLFIFVLMKENYATLSLQRRLDKLTKAIG